MKKIICLSFAVLLAAAPACRAEVIVLNSGKVIEGSVRETTPEYLKVASPNGEIYFQWEFIKSVDGIESVYARRLAEKERQLQEAGKRLAELKCVYEVSLANACMKAGWFDQAFDAYTGALRFDSAISEAHYNIALIYRHHKNDPRAAVEHFRKYLELKPGAEDKELVEGEIASLEKSL